MKTSKEIITLFFVLVTINLSAQEIIDCKSEINHSAHGHMFEMLDCDQPLLIKATTSERIIIDGIFVTKGGVRILPDNGGVVIGIPNHIEIGKNGGAHGKTHVRIPPPSTGGRFAEFKKKNAPSLENDKIHQSTGFLDTMKVSPNPVNDVLTLHYSKDILEIHVYNSFGIRIQQVNYQKSNNKVIMDWSALKRGLYTLKIYTADDVIHTKRIIKS